MSRTICRGLVVCVLVHCSSLPVSAQALPKCSQDHPGRQHRAESLAKRGDSRMAWSAAAHATKYAVERFALKDLVKESDLEPAFDATYEFLKWKLGNSAAIAATWLDAGYGHFDKAYSDEAAAILIGFQLPAEKGGHSTFRLPPQLVELRRSLGKATAPVLAKAIESEWGIPAAMSEPLIKAWVDIENDALKRAGFSLPKKYDFPNGLLRAAIDAKRDPAGYAKRFQQRLDAITKQEAGSQDATPPRHSLPSVRKRERVSSGR